MFCSIFGDCNTSTSRPKALFLLLQYFMQEMKTALFFCLSTYLFMYLFINFTYLFISFSLSMYKINCFDILISNFVGDFLSLGLCPRLVGFVMNILAKLINKQVKTLHCWINSSPSRGHHPMPYMLTNWAHDLPFKIPFSSTIKSMETLLNHSL